MADDAAVHQAREALKGDPDSPERIARLARALCNAVWNDTSRWTPYYQEAGRLYRRLCKLDPANPAHLVNLGVVRSDQGQHREALKLYRKAEAMNWDDGNLDFNIGVALVNLGEHEEGRKFMHRSNKRKQRSSTMEAYFDFHAH